MACCYPVEGKITGRSPQLSPLCQISQVPQASPQAVLAHKASPHRSTKHYFMTLQEEVQRLQSALQRSAGDVDILLTCQWPAQITECLPAAAPAAPPGAAKMV